jgi:serine/threonine protein kinase
MAERIGQQLGHYQLQRLLGQGGFADVYLGEHIHLKNVAAIKILHARLTADMQEDFLREAQMLARLLHPHIIRVLDFGVEENVPYLVMDYAAKGSLRQRHPYNTRVPMATVVDYVRQIGEGLQYAHDQKLIHRDLKPDNVLIGAGDDLLLSDFGVAIAAQSTRSQESEPGLAGTAAYMAPEQLSGKPVFASDQYALGVMVYEWLCGARPFQGSLLELYIQHAHTPPPPLREHMPDLPLAVEQVVLRAIAKEPGQRYGSVKDFVDALVVASESTRRAEVFQHETWQIQEVDEASSADRRGVFPPGVSRLSLPALQATRLQQFAGFMGEQQPVQQIAASTDEQPVQQFAGFMGEQQPVQQIAASTGEQPLFVKREADGRYKRPSTLKISLLTLLALLVIMSAGAAALYAFSRPSHGQAGRVMSTSTAQAAATQSAETAGGQVVARPTQASVLPTPIVVPASATPAATSVATTSVAASVASTPMATPVASMPTATPVAPTPTPKPAPVVKPTPTPKPAAPTCPPQIESGSTGTWVRVLQSDLNTAYAKHIFADTPYSFVSPLMVDGTFGPMTTAATKDFQAAKGLGVDGMVGPLTWHALGYC